MYNRYNSLPNLHKKKLSVKYFSLKDSNSFITLFRKVFSLPPWNEDLREEDTRDVLVKMINRQDSLILTALYYDEYAGFIGGSSYWRVFNYYRVFYLEQLFIDPEIQGKGVGKELLLSFKRVLKQKKNTVYHPVNEKRIAGRKALYKQRV